MKKHTNAIANPLPPIFDGIPIIWEDDPYPTLAEAEAAEKMEAELRAVRKENRLLKKELAALRKKSNAKKK